MSKLCAGEIRKALEMDDFTIVNLGAAGDKDFPSEFLKSITLIELDAISGAKTNESNYRRLIKIKNGINSKHGKRLFHKRKWPECSSFLEVDKEVVKAYGHEDCVEPDGDIELECETLEAIFAKNHIKRADYIKTDLEGLDFEILANSPEIVSQALVVQSELRFEPFYTGEPYFHTTSEFMTKLGFDMISMRPEVWKLDTANRENFRDGRLVFADAIFFLSPEKIKERFRERAGIAFIKQIVLAKILGLNSYAEFLYENTRKDLSEGADNELNIFLKCSLTNKAALQQFLNRTANFIANIPGGYFLIRLVYHLSVMTARATSINKKLKWLGSL